MTGAFTLLCLAALYFSGLALLFRARKRLGIGVFLCALGVMHFLETYLAAVFFIQSPFGLVSPGSTVMFAGKLAMMLLIYIEEDAETVRQPIYGLLVGNFLVVACVLALRVADPVTLAVAGDPDLGLLSQIGMLMMWGTVLLFADSIGLILLYEHLRKFAGPSLFVRAWIALSLILSVDQVFFFFGLHLVAGTPIEALTGNWVAKMVAAAVYSLMLNFYFKRVTLHPSATPDQPTADVFATLTYRQRYEDLLVRSGTDALTGALNRGRFDVMAKAAVARAVAVGRPISLLMVDVDHFKKINDTHGHLIGDDVLRRMIDVLRRFIRIDDRIFRYGGEEFAVLCDGLPHDTAIANADRLREAVAAAVGEILPIAVTISIGVATGPEDGKDVTELVRQADLRLYQAKHNGRNQVVGSYGPSVASGGSPLVSGTV